MTQRKPIDDGGRLNVRLPKPFLVRLKVECVRKGISLQAATEEALRAWLRKGGDR